MSPGASSDKGLLWFDEGGKNRNRVDSEISLQLFVKRDNVRTRLIEDFKEHISAVFQHSSSKLETSINTVVEEGNNRVRDAQQEADN
eukprot:756455-Hanusia_phi.AAC.1